MPQVKIISSVSYDGKVKITGDELTVSDERAADWVRRKLCEIIEKKEPESLVVETVEIPGVAGSFEVESMKPDGTLVVESKNETEQAEEKVAQSGKRGRRPK